MAQPTDVASIPRYISVAHGAWLWGTSKGGTDLLTNVTDYSGNLGFNITAMMQDSWMAGSPYEGAIAYDPSGDLDDIRDNLTRFEAAVDAIVPGTTWTTFIDAASAKADILFGDSTGRISARTTVYEGETLPAFMRSLSRMSAAAFDSASSQGSGLMAATALLELGRHADAQAYKARLEEINEQGRANMIAHGTESMMNLQNAQMQWERDLHSMYDSLARLSIVANKEYYAEDLEYGVEDATWDMRLFQYGVAVMAGINGAPVLQKGPSKAATSISTALTFASTAVQMASPLGKAGAIGAGIVGAIIGAVAGAV